MRILQGATRYATVLCLACFAQGWAGETEEDLFDSVLEELERKYLQAVPDRLPEDDRRRTPVWAWVVHDRIPLKDGKHTVHTLRLGDMVEVLQTRSATVEVRPFSRLKTLPSGWLPAKAVMYEEDAGRYFSKLIRDGKDVARACYGRAMVRCIENPLPDIGALTYSIDDLDQAIQRDESYLAARVERAVANMHLGNFEEAITDVNIVIRNDPAVVWGYWIRAECHAGTGAIRAKRGDAELSQDAYRQALNDYDKAISLAPNEGMLYRERAEVHIAISQYEQAISDLDRVREVDPLLGSVRLRARALLGQERYREVIAVVDDAISKEWDEDDAYACKGQAHLALGQYGRALAAYEHAAKRGFDEDYEAQKAVPWILATSPDARYRNGARALALALRVCVYVGHDMEGAHFDLGKAAHDRSRPFQREWVREGWRDWRCFDVLAAAYAECGEFQEAIAWQEKVVKLAPEERRLEVERRLSLYRQHRPYRMEPPANKTGTDARSKASPTGSVVSPCRYRRLRHGRRGQARRDGARMLGERKVETWRQRKRL